MASILLFTRVNISGNMYLGVFLLFNVIQGFSSIVLSNNFTNEISSYLFLSIAPLSLLIGPALYFYTKKKLNPAYTLKTNQLLHLAPFLYFFIQCLPYTISPLSEKIQFIEKIHENAQLIFKIKLLIGDSFQLYFFRPIHILVYTAICINQFQKNKTNLTHFLTKFQASNLTKWLKLLLYSTAIIHVCNFFNMLYIYLISTPILNTRLPLSYIAGIALSNVAIHIFINPYILYGFSNVKYYSNDSFIARLHRASTRNATISDEKWKNDLILKIESNEVKLSLTEKGYNLAKMSEELDTTMYHLNFYFKEISRETFTEFKNRKRIEFAIQLINDDYLSAFTVEKLSLICGFANRANFNNNFLKATGMSLKEFKKTVK